MDIISHNSIAWNEQSGELNEWTIPVSKETIKLAKKNKATVLLTNSKTVPTDWYMPIKGKKILCLACGGGQQAPIFSAMGANVVVMDNSEGQLDKDRMVTKREKLSMEILQGDMRDLSRFKDGSFDMVFQPISNCFIDNPQLVWNECYRVLKKSGVLLSGFLNPLLFLFDLDDMEKGELNITNTIPYSDLDQLPKETLDKLIKNNNPIEYGHSLETQIAGQIQAGFVINGFYEDISKDETIDKYIKTSIATKAIKI